MTTIRAAKSTYVVFAVLWLVPFLPVAISAVIQPGDMSVWPTLLLLTVYGAVLMAWVHTFRIDMCDGVIRYRSLFGGRREVRVAEIESAAIRVGNERYTDRFLPPVRLELRVRSGTPAAGKLTINLKVFSRSDVAALMEYIQHRHDAI